MYKITLCNLGYDDTEVQELNDYKDTLESCLNKIKNNIKNSVDGYKVTKTNYNVTEKDFNDNETINIIETEDFERCIYISKI